jgi:hypothetical protein
VIEHDPRRGVAIAAGTDQGENVSAGSGRDRAAGHPVWEPVRREFRHQGDPDARGDERQRGGEVGAVRDLAGHETGAAGSAVTICSRIRVP